MSGFQPENLIDLSAEEGKDFEQNNLEEVIQEHKLLKLTINSTNGRDSMENNPFDKAFKVADMSDDPFESVFYEAESYSKSADVEVETGNLVSLPVDRAEVEANQNSNEDSKSKKNSFLVPQFNRMGSTVSSNLSSISSINSLQSPSHLDNNVFDSESLQTDVNSSHPSLMTLNKGFLSETVILSECNDDSSNVFNKCFVNSSSMQLSPKSGSESKIQNTTENSEEMASVSARDSLNENKEKPQIRKKDINSLLKLSLTNSAKSPLFQSGDSDGCDQSVFSEANSLAEKLSKLVTSDSPKDDSCDDIMAIKPRWLDSEVESDSDLEMLKIPMLEEIEHGTKSSEKLVEDTATFKIFEKEDCLNGNPVNSDNYELVASRRSLDLIALKERIELERQKKEYISRSDVDGLIQSLKKIVFECSNDDKKAEANNLLESLSNILAKRNEENVDIHIQPPTPPRPIIRQDTFDLDTSSTTTNSSQDKNEIRALNGPLPLLQGNDKVEMSQNFQPATPDIVQQIGKLFGNENINMVHRYASLSSNPTYIVVMGTPVPPVRQATQIYNKVGDGSPEFASAEIRGRSQSLSLYDKSRLQKVKPKASPLKDNMTLRPNTIHRKSLSSTPHISNLSSVRRSIYGSKGDLNEDNGRCRDYQNTIKHPVPQTNREVVTPSRTTKIMKPEIIPKKLKVKSTEVAPKPRGPLKAIIPAKEMAPMIVTSSVSSPIENKKKQKPITSTPRIAPITSQVPNACSTPAVKFQLSPAKNVSKTRSRYSIVSATPKLKSNNVATSLPRRRSLCELKSPRRGLESVREIGIGKPQVKTIKLPQDFVKTVNTLGPGKTTRPFKRESLLQKNKENKIPRSAK